IGPSDCEHSAEFFMLISELERVPSSFITTRCGVVSRPPNGFAPLQSFCARPSQKLRKLKTASTTLGALRPPVLRVLIVLEGSDGSGSVTSCSTLVVSPGAVPIVLFALLLEPLTPLPAEGNELPCRLLGLMIPPGDRIMPARSRSLFSSCAPGSPDPLPLFEVL